MKKNETKKTVKKEKITLEKLASLIEKLAVFTVNGFEELRQEFRQEISSVKEEVSSVKEEVASIKEEQKDNTRRLISIERKLSGTLLSLDETVHRNEFSKLEHRVEALES